MNTAHLHLLTNHLSLVGIGFTLLVNIIALARRNDELLKICCWLYILTALTAILPIVTGDGSKEILATYPGISTDAIELHETWGYVFFYGTLVTGAIALAGLWFTRKSNTLLKRFGFGLMILTVIILVFAWQAGYTGGLLRHPEILQGAFGKAG